MEIKKYRHANCNLFRTPSLNYGTLESQITDALIKKWESGAQADKIFYDMMGNSEILDTLSQQIQENLEFQRLYALDRLRKSEEQRLEGLAKEKASMLGTIDETIGAEVQQKNLFVDEADQRYKTVTKSYNAAQTRLEEMRSRIKDRLDKLGGEDGLGMLIQIDQSITGAAPPGYAADGTNGQAGYDAGKQKGKKESGGLFGFFKKMFTRLNIGKYLDEGDKSG